MFDNPAVRSLSSFFIRLRQNTLWLVTGMNGGTNRAGARRAKAGGFGGIPLDTPPQAAGSFINTQLFRCIFFTNRARLFTFILILPVIFSLGCEAVKRPAPREILGIHEMERLISSIRDQQDKVSSFFSTGSILIKGWIWKSEADILIAGVRDPFKIKVEITHPWGTPILHLLIDGERLEALSFSEKRIYLGDFTPQTIARFLPGTICDQNLIWSVLRGFPFIERYHRAESLEKNIIRLLNLEGKDIEIIGFSKEKVLPEEVIFPEKALELLFSRFREDKGSYYAEEVTVNNINGAKDLVIERKNMVVNNSIPDEIFTLERPPTFETVFLDKGPNDEGG